MYCLIDAGRSCVHFIGVINSVPGHYFIETETPLRMKCMASKEHLLFMSTDWHNNWYNSCHNNGILSMNVACE